MELGVYQIVKKLATGGMAEIFLARHQSTEGFQRNLVIKRILPEFSEDPTFVASFLNEAKLAGQLNHPNIVQIYDLGRAQNSYFIAMEYIQGFDISSILRLHRRMKSYVPLPVALRIFCDVCAGLDYAHHAKDLEGKSLGVVHRDVTPSNVLVSMDGPAKVVDFGIAKATARGDGKTKTGTIKGKFAYLAPEQVLGKEIDHRVDVFACGIMLCELLTNKNPFRGETEYLSLQNIINGTVEPLAKFRDDVPPIFDDIIKKALSRDPDARYQSCAELMGSVELAATASSITLSHGAVHELLKQNEATLKEIEARRNAGDDSQLSGEAMQVSSIELTGQEMLLEPMDDTRVRPRTGSVQQPPKPRRLVMPVVVGVLLLTIIALASMAVKRIIVHVPSYVEPQLTAIEIVSDPPGAQVLLNGVLVTGQTPLRLLDVEVGKTYLLRLVRQGYNGASATVTLDKPGLHTVQMALAVAPAQPKPRAPVAVVKVPESPKKQAAPESNEPGRLRIVVQPWGTVQIDGEKVGDTPFPARPLSPGMHKVTIENSDLKKRVTRNVKVVSGKEVVLREDLAKD